ncbi:hypothetical protein V6C32_11450 [Desulforamulus ruminis]|uniref:hypothetical protein n=1 Tax=Desulforamulus ruminis TaxID=1564 RepID=UPI002FDAC0D4
MKMTSRFGDYREHISEDILKGIEPAKMNKFIAVLKLKYPPERADITTRKEDVKALLEKHNSTNKESTYIELLDIKNIYLILGLELPDTYDINNKEKKQVSRYIGNFISRKLYHDYGWNEFTNVDNALFTIVEIKAI